MSSFRRAAPVDQMKPSPKTVPSTCDPLPIISLSWASGQNQAIDGKHVSCLSQGKTKLQLLYVHNHALRNLLEKPPVLPSGHNQQFKICQSHAQHKQNICGPLPHPPLPMYVNVYVYGYFDVYVDACKTSHMYPWKQFGWRHANSFTSCSGRAT